jgi:lantibiotic modifying enzyme
VSPLEAAARIARALCGSAYWDADGRLCNWIGRSPAESDMAGGLIAPTWEALEPYFYTGSAGIALFLTRLHGLTGDPDLRRTALAAIARSIRCLRRPAPKGALPPLSFHFGGVGIAHAAWTVAESFGCAELLADVASITASLGDAIATPHDLDVIGGNAGAIPALLAMSRTPGLSECHELAIMLGDELCRLDPTRSGVLCARDDRPNAAELVHSTPSGLSHGASGIGAALLELHGATGRTGFRDAARRAFKYEDTLFDAEYRNWAPLRRTEGDSRYEIAWCNGAPGIALARLRAAALDPGGREDYLAMARIGIATTVDAIDKLLALPRYDATPCHGLSGLIEIVWLAGRMLDDVSYRDRALAAAQVLIERYSDRGDWPSGLYSGGPNPSLMLGTAGIGYTFLRLHDPGRVPSVLWIGC